jgi:hypothetical protein
VNEKQFDTVAPLQKKETPEAIITRIGEDDVQEECLLSFHFPAQSTYKIENAKER